MTKKPIPYKFRALYFVIFVLLFVLGMPILIFYSTGYTIDETFDVSARGGIYVFVPESETSVFIGNDLKDTSSFFKREVLVKDLKPDQYLVLVANDNFWPWAKIVNVKEGEVEALFPLLVPKVAELEEILPTDTDYEDSLSLFEPKTETPSLVSSSASSSSLISRRRVDVWQEGNFIFSEWRGSESAAPKYFCGPTSCTDPVLIFQTFLPIKNFNFYPDRDDAIILALDNGIYAIELDRRPYQNFYPIYQGQDADFVIDGNDLYIKDGTYLARMSL